MRVGISNVYYMVDLYTKFGVGGGQLAMASAVTSNRNRNRNPNRNPNPNPNPNAGVLPTE